MKQQLRQLSLKNQARDKDETLRQLLDELLDISEEVDLMNEIKDVHDELVMIKSIFASQLDVIIQLRENTTYRNPVKPLPLSVIDKCNRLYELVDQRRAKVEEMDETAARAYKSLNNLFDLKRQCYTLSKHILLPILTNGIQRSKPMSLKHIIHGRFLKTAVAILLLCLS